MERAKVGQKAMGGHHSVAGEEHLEGFTRIVGQGSQGTAHGGTVGEERGDPIHGLRLGPPVIEASVMGVGDGA